MRVKLSYTVEEEDVLKEGAKILNMSSDDMQQAISLFTGIQVALSPPDKDEVVNVSRAM